MFHRLKLVTVGVAALAVSGAAHANEVSSQVNIGATVVGACSLGSPNITEIDLGDLSGPDGLLAAPLKASTTVGTAVIADAWCNTSHRLTIEGQPMTLETAKPYAQPAYMTRHITFDAKLIGWAAPVGFRPRSGSDQAFLEWPEARAAPASGLRLNISKLETLTAARAEQPNLMLEAGTYRGRVTVTLATN